MTEPTPAAESAPTTPPAAAPAPETPAPAPAPAKKSPGRVVLSIVLAILVFGVLYVVRGVLSDSSGDFKAGACVNVMPASTTVIDLSNMKVVDCSSRDAQAKIVEAYDGKGIADAEQTCRTAAVVAAAQVKKWNGQTKLLCLGRK
jgi:hypothetical protein